MKATNILKTMLVLSALGLSFAWSSPVQADDPPVTPSISVLVYYDGSPELAQIHDHALLGFTEAPDYLPAVETDDLAAFSNAIAGGDYRVFVGLSMDTAAAEQWADEVEAAGFAANLAAIVPGPGGEHQWDLKLVKHAEMPGLLPAPPTPSSEEMPWPAEASLASQVTGGDKYLGNAPTGPLWNWLEEVQRKLREKLAETLRKIAEILEQMKETKAKVKWHAEVEVGGTPPAVTGKISVDVEFDTTAQDAAKIAKALAELVQPPPKTP